MQILLRAAVVGALVSYQIIQSASAEEGAVVAATESLTEADFLGEIPVALSASRLKQPLLDAPVSITIIDRDMIKASGLIDLPDLMQFVPGFQVAHANSNLAVVTYHGLAESWPKRMQFLVDGRSVYQPLVSNVDFSTIGVVLDDIERIEVIQGSDASAYGSNAFLAAINIITRQPFQQRGAYAQFTSGSISTRDIVARYGGAIGKFDYRFTANSRSDDGFPGVNDETRARGFNMRGIYTPTTTDSLEAQLGYNDGEFGAWGTKENDWAVNKFRDKTVQSSYVFLRWQRAFSDTQDLQVQYYHNRYDEQDRFPIIFSEVWPYYSPSQIQAILGNRTDQSITHGIYNGETRRDDLEIQHASLPFPDVKVAWGGGLRSDRARSFTWFNRNDWISDQSLRLFLHTEWHATARLVVNAGAMAEHNSLVETQTSSRLGLNYHLVEDQVLRAAVSRSRRTPSLWEERVQWSSHFDDGSVLQRIWYSPGNLRPERLTSYELGYRGEARGMRLDWDVKLFRERFRDMINGPYDYAIPQLYPGATGNGAIVVMNTDGAAVHGGEARLSYRPVHGALFNFQYNYARANGEYQTRLHKKKIGTVYNSYSTAEPLHTVSAMAGYTYRNGWQLSMSISHIDNLKWMGDGDQVDGHDRYDARIAKSFEWSDMKGELALIGQNLSESYVDFEEHNIFERRTYLQASFQF
jgi:iron complex outermembrane receptor protein